MITDGSWAEAGSALAAAACPEDAAERTLAAAASTSGLDRAWLWLSPRPGPPTVYSWIPNRGLLRCATSDPGPELEGLRRQAAAGRPAVLDASPGCWTCVALPGPRGIVGTLAGRLPGPDTGSLAAWGAALGIKIAQMSAEAERVAERERRASWFQTLEDINQITAGARPSTDEISGVAPELAEEVDRLSCLVRDILEYARPCDSRKVRVDLSRLVPDCTEQFAGGLDGSNPVRVFSPAPLQPDLVLPVEVNDEQIRRLLTDLLRNGVDACKDAGGEARVQVDVAESDGDAVISVRDTGAGIDEETRRRVFDPFFTTKGGTGLGMCIVKSLVEANEGSMRIWSAPGRGTTVELRFRMAPGEIARDGDAGRGAA